ncbi:MAG: trans-4-hydroxy-L-proline dehydratase [Candidatus Acetothermia bacterium]
MNNKATSCPGVKGEFQKRQSKISPVNSRIAELREETVNRRPKITPERAVLVTEFYRENDLSDLPTPVSRALALRYILENKELSLQPGELIVGDRGPEPKLVPTYPEICTHSLDDLEILDKREKNPYLVDDETREIYKREIIPFWEDRTMRERVFDTTSDEWQRAYNAGVFTEFMEQRSPGHTVLGGKIYKKGFLDLLEDIRESRESLASNDPKYRSKIGELRAMKIAAQALMDYASRYVDKLEGAARFTEDEGREKELRQMAEICRRVPAHSPRTFWEALQYYWFVHVGVITETNPWDSFCPGRLDQHLFPFYVRGTEEGSLSEKRVKELLQAFWIKFHNQPAPPKVGVTAQESNTYSDFSKINVGGVTGDGKDAVNDLTYLILDVVESMRLVQPNFMVQVSQKNPDRYLERALEITKSGFGQPAIFNAESIITQLLRQGKSLEDARRGGCSGCVETGAFGKESYILTGYFNMPKVLELTLHNGVDPGTGKRIGPATGGVSTLATFEEFFKAYRKQLHYFLDIKIEGNKRIQELYGEHLPSPFLSLLIDDCIGAATDYNAGGARYDTAYIQGVGLGTMADALTAIKFNVYDREVFTFSELLEAIEGDFRGNEEVMSRLNEDTPKYGNDLDYADEQMQMAFEAFFEGVDGRPNGRGGTHRVNMLPTTVHIYFGQKCGALPDGRRAKTPLSEGISPVQGADSRGPTAVFRSVGKLDHAKTGGTLLNQKLTPDLLDGEVEVRKLSHLIRAFFRMGGHHVQFNVIGADLLREAQEKPEDYQNLIVRVAGYSDYFVNLSDGLQDEIIERTEQSSF